MLKHLLAPLVLASALLGGIATAASTEHHINAKLEPVGNSGVSGTVMLTALPKGGTLITIVAKGLHPGTQYLSLYYENGTCDLEPYEEDDVIGRYTADASGEARVTNKLDDDLDEIHSVSVRAAGDFALQACAAVNQ